MIRFLQVIKFGWKHSAQMKSQKSNNMLRRCCIFVDMLYCFFVYKMWTNQYLKENFYNLNDDERQKLWGRYKEEGQKRTLEEFKRLLSKIDEKLDLPVKQS